MVIDKKYKNYCLIYYILLLIFVIICESITYKPNKNEISSKIMLHFFCFNFAQQIVDLVIGFKNN